MTHKVNTYKYNTHVNRLANKHTHTHAHSEKKKKTAMCSASSELIKGLMCRKHATCDEHMCLHAAHAHDVHVNRGAHTHTHVETHTHTHTQGNTPPQKAHVAPSNADQMWKRLSSGLRYATTSLGTIMQKGKR